MLSLYTCYSESHKRLYADYFMKTLPAAGNVSLAARVIPQVCPSGEFRQEGWNRMGLEKVKIMLKACQSNDVFVFSDCDVVFFKPLDSLLEQLGDFDFVGQDDSKGICSGFFVCRRNERTLAMFERMVALLSSAKEVRMADQYALNACLRTVHHRKIPLALVSSVRFFRGSAVTNKRAISEITVADLPPTMLAFHANWCCSLELKSLLLARVLSLMPDSSMVERAAVNR